MNSTDDLYDISDFIINSIYPNSTVCDLGFGNTFLLQKIINKNQNIRYIGVDSDGALCDKVQTFMAGNNINNAQVYAEDIVDFDSQRCDICVISRVFHHFDKNESEKIFANAFKMISHKGRIIIIDSFRDYSNRKDRFNYFPLFFIHQLSLLGIDNVCCDKCEISSINIDELWKLVVDIDNKTALISFEKYNEKKGI